MAYGHNHQWFDSSRRPLLLFKTLSLNIVFLEYGQINSQMVFAFHSKDINSKIKFTLTKSDMQKCESLQTPMQPEELEVVLHSLCFQVVPVWFLLTHFPSCLLAG